MSKCRGISIAEEAIMDGAIRAPVAAIPSHGPSGTAIAAVGVLVGVALAALFSNAIRDAGGLGEIGPFNAPTELCRFNTFSQPEILAVSAPRSGMPAMVSRCDFLFQEGQYIAVGYRL